MIAVATVVGLLALGLVITNLAARDIVLLPLVWVQAILPGLVGAWVLLGPRFNIMPQGRLIRPGAA